MAHAAQHKRKTQYTKSEKILGAVLLAVVILTVSLVWVLDLSHGTHTAPIIHHVTHHPAVVRNAVSNAARAAAAKAAAAKAAAAAASGALGAHVAIKHYTVKAGDTLWGIAKVKLHNPLLWRKLYAMNINIIGSNPNVIVAGQSLLL